MGHAKDQIKTETLCSKMGGEGDILTHTVEISIKKRIAVEMWKIEGTLVSNQHNKSKHTYKSIVLTNQFNKTS